MSKKNNSQVSPISDISALQTELGVGGAKQQVKSVEEWLDRLHLGTYKELFLGQAIELMDLDMLTSDMLKEIGVSTLGHRLKMLRGAQFIRAQEQFQRRNTPLIKPFTDHCQATCFAQRYKITASTLTVTKPECCSSHTDPVDLTEIVDVNFSLGCCFGKVEILTEDPTMPSVTMKLTNKKCEEVSALLINAKERDEQLNGHQGDSAVRGQPGSRGSRGFR